MKEKDESKQSRNIFKSKEGRLIIVLFALVFIFVAAMDFFWSGKKIDSATGSPSVSQDEQPVFSSFRNKRIDSMTAKVIRSRESPYSQSDIDSAVDAVKEHFKSADFYISLSQIMFDEERCNRIRDAYYLHEEYSDSNLIVLLCDYNVFISKAAYKAGFYENYNLIMKRDTAQAPWEIVDSGY